MKERPLDILHFKRRMQDLDVAHARARSPESRRRIEKSMRKLRAELAEHEEAEARLEKHAAAWWAVTLSRRTGERLMPTQNGCETPR